MIDDKHAQPGEAVRDPLVSNNSENSAALEPLTAPESGGSQVGNGADDTSPVGAYRRVRLNPSVDESHFKAIPSLPPSSSSAAPAPSAATLVEPPPGSIEVPDAAASSSPSNDAVPTPYVSPEPEAHATESPQRHQRATATIEIPPPVKELDAELEAEINAALASGELDLGATAGASAAASAAADEETGQEKPAEELLEAGHHLTGRIQSIHGDGVLLDLGYRSPGVVALRQFVSGKKPEVGQQIEVLVERVAQDEGLIYLNLPKGVRRIAGNWEALAKGQTVDCIVNRSNKGGLEVTVGGLRAFLPSSQVELGFVSDLTPYIGQKLRVEVVEVNKKKRNLIVSRRAILQLERQEAEEKLWETLDVGQTYTGRVKTIKDYGAFVDLGSVDGFLHIGEMSWQRIKHPSEIVKEGQTVDVKVLSLDREKKKISLGMKQLAQNPWTTAAERFPANSAVTGKVTRIADFGAFVELEPGLEGLIHVSELDHKRIRHTSDVLKVHQVVTAQVLEVDVDRKRISLSLKALMARPEEKKAEPEPAPEPYQHRHKGPLKGGTGGGLGGGLFGNPTDFTR